MLKANVRFNYHDYLQLPEDKRYEILDGELFVVPAPNIRHQTVAKRIAMALIRQLEETRLGDVFLAPCDVVFSEENVLQPDVIFIRKERSGIIAEANVSGAPDLVIEILSPATRTKDLELKRKIYAAFGVKEYWVVDPEASTVEVLSWSESGYTAAGHYGASQSLASRLLPELSLPLSSIFEKK